MTSAASGGGVAGEGVLLTLAYDGSGFSGWAPQPTARTVAGELLEAIRTMRPSVDEVRGASRTDAGVHARGQRVAFDVDQPLPTRGWVLGLGARLSPQISVRSASIVERGFTPRHRARGKRYVYTLLVDRVRDPFLERLAWRIERSSLDLDAMRLEAARAAGTHDFKAFRAAADERVDTTRTLSRLELVCDADDARVVRVVVEGDRFMYNMVRIIVGTLVDVGLGRLAPGAMGRALASGRRDDLGRTAPAHGLVLDEVFLVDEGRDRWPER